MNLHDGVIQSLYGVALGLGARLRSLNGDSDRTRDILNQAMAQLYEVIADVRGFISDLRAEQEATPDLGLGLATLAQELASNR